MGRAQLDAPLDDIVRAVTLLAAQVDQNASARQVARAVRADVERARAIAQTLERLIALEGASLRLAEVEVSDLLMATLARWKARAPRQTFELALPGHEPTLLGDAALIEQAIEGLIAWAAAHSGPGDIRVSLRLAHPAEQGASVAGGEDADGQVSITVRCPLTSTESAQNAENARLLDCFSQPRPGDACALELELARAIAERHGGRAWAESAPEDAAIRLTLALPSSPAESLASTAPLDTEPEELEAATGDPLALARARRSIVVAHGDARMARYLRANLEAADYSAKTATTLSAALRLIELEEPDLALVDLALPDDESRDPLASALARTTAPIVALGQSDDPAACVAALDAGAADFIAQPLSVEEALARVRRALRPQRGQASEDRQRIFTCGGLMIDDAQRLVTIDGSPAQLSKTEYRLLRTLAQNLGKTLSHEALLTQVWGPAYSKEIEFVWVYIRRLRRKIEPDPARPCYILTAPGVGYRLAYPTAR